jgi:hypothetical protein
LQLRLPQVLQRCKHTVSSLAVHVASTCHRDPAGLARLQWGRYTFFTLYNIRTA